MRKFLAVARMAFIDGIIYREDMFLWSAGLIIGPLIFLIVWLAVIASGGKTPLSQTEFIQYFLLVMVVRIWASAWNSQFIARDIRTGYISAFLMKPIPYLAYRFGDNIGNKLVKAFFSLITILIFFIIFQVTIPNTDTISWIFAILSFIMAGFLIVMIDICIGLLAFWMDDITSVDESFDVLYGVFSGAVIPLSVFPDFIQTIFVYLPFKYVVAYPVEIILGKSQGVNLGIGLTIQLFWLVLFFVLYKCLWANGQKRYQAFGN